MSLFTFKGCLRSLLAVFPLFAMGGMAQTSGSGTSLIRGVESLPGIYSLSGQRLRNGNDLTGLPSGIYIVNGKKYVVK